MKLCPPIVQLNPALGLTSHSDGSRSVRTPSDDSSAGLYSGGLLNEEFSNLIP